MNELRRLNLNEKIKVKLTDLGRDIYYHRYDRLIEANINIKPSFPKEDKNGFSTFQLWDFMNIYGSYIGMCLPNVTEDLYLYVEEESLK